MAQGVDTLVLTGMGAPLSPVLLADLKRRRTALQDPPPEGEAGPDPALVELAGEPWELQPHGASGGYAYLLVTADATVTLRDRPDAPATIDTVRVTVRSSALWATSLPDVVERVRAVILPALAPAGAPVLPPERIGVSRLDLAVDFQGWTPTVEEVEALAVVRARRTHYSSLAELEGAWTAGLPPHEASWARAFARSRRAERESEERQAQGDLDGARKQLDYSRGQLKQAAEALVAAAGEHDRADYHARSREYTGSTFGAGGKVSFRLYDKSREIASSRKWWFRDVWAASGVYVAAEPVWRVEGQLRRDVLRDELGVRSAADLLAPDKLASVWAYLSRDWLSFRLDDDANTSRRTVDPRWAVIASATFGAVGPVVPAVRVTAAKRAVTRERAVAMIASGVSTVAALAPSGEPPTIAGTLRAIEPDVVRYFERKAPPARSVEAYLRDAILPENAARLAPADLADLRRAVAHREFERVVARKRARYSTPLASCALATSALLTARRALAGVA